MMEARLNNKDYGRRLHCLVRPSLADLAAIEIRASRAEGKNAIHAVESAIRWMRDLLNAPTWTPALQSAWDMYRRGIDSALSGGPNAIAVAPPTQDSNEETK